MLRPFLFVAGLLFLTPPVFAETLVKHPNAEVELMTEYDNLVLGEPVGIGLEIRPQKDWHTYWRNPGDSGAAPKISWEIESGVEIGPLQWPTPERIEASGIVTFGYHGKTLLFSSFAIPSQSSLKEGQVLNLKVKSEWLVCKDICVPVFANFEKKLKVVEAKASKPSSQFKNFQRDRARLPLFAKDVFEVEVKSQKDSLSLYASPLKGQLEVVDFFPSSKMMVDYTKPKISFAKGAYKVDLKNTTDSEVSGLIFYRDAKRERYYSAWLETASPSGGQASFFWIALLLAFIGGLALNLMPCVFPIISIKAFSLVKSAKSNRKRVIQESLAYSVGVILTFLVAAAFLLIFRSYGELVGWGFQLQSPRFVALMGLLFFVLGLNFIGAFDFNFSFAGFGQGATEKPGLAGSFFTGVLSVIVASPCTAPFMGAALGYAMTQTTLILFTIFLALGLGLAFPYLVLASFPASARILPKPGAWMQTFKEFLAFPMWATMLWLLWLLSQQVGANSSFLVAFAFLFIALGFWWARQSRSKSPVWRAAIILLVAGLSVFCLMKADDFQTTSGKSIAQDGIEWQEFSTARVEESLQNQERVFIDFTADWCLTCKVNEKVTFSQKEVQDFIREKGITMFKADWTRRDEEITKMLESYERIGVPLYLYFEKGSKRAIILPEILTPGIFMSTIESKTSP